MNEGKVSLSEIAKLFLLMGFIGFGGGPAIIALIQDYTVMRKRWLDIDEFSHGVALGQVMGPFAVNASIFIGYRLRGLIGAIIAATAFLAPSVVAVIVLSVLYFRYSHVPSLKSALNGIAPVVTALIIAAAYSIGRARFHAAETVALAAAAFALSAFAHLPVVIILLLTAAYGLLRLQIVKEEPADEEF